MSTVVVDSVTAASSIVVFNGLMRSKSGNFYTFACQVIGLIVCFALLKCDCCLWSRR